MPTDDILRKERALEAEKASKQHVQDTMKWLTVVLEKYVFGLKYATDTEE